MFTSDVTKAHSYAALLFTGNYCLFAHIDVSYRLNGKNDNVVLECLITLFCRYFLIF